MRQQRDQTHRLSQYACQHCAQYEVKTSWGRRTWRGWIEDENGATVSFAASGGSSPASK